MVYLNKLNNRGHHFNSISETKVYFSSVMVNNGRERGKGKREERGQ